MLVSSALEGLVAATISPLAMTVGFVMWEKQWKGSAIALNAFKGVLGATVFAVLIFAFQPIINIAHASPHLFSTLIVSSVLGIILGDTFWLMALPMLGARRLIFCDALKPFCAALLGAVVLGESVTLSMCLGMILTVTGVATVALERTGGSDESGGAEDCEDDDGSKARAEAEERLRNRRLAGALALGALNIIFDVYGAVLVKQFAASLSPLEIACVRFGFAGVVLTALVGGAYAVAALRGGGARKRLGGAQFVELASSAAHSDEAGFSRASCDDEEAQSSVEATAAETTTDQSGLVSETDDRGGSGGGGVPEWLRWPGRDEQTLRNWALVVCAILVVTVLCPALNNFALFRVHLAISQTLGGLGPVFAIPVTALLKREAVTLKACLGASLAVAGLVPFYLAHT